MSNSPTNDVAVGQTGTGAGFPVTHWSLVDAAASTDGGEALEQICQGYWYPLYAFARRSGQGPADAEDLTQGFFLALIEKHWLADAEREKGRLRTFLLTAFRRFMAKEWRKIRAEKRGGQHELVSIEMVGGEARYAAVSEGLSPERLFDRQWALGLMDQTMVSLRDEFSKSNKAQHFESLKEVLVLQQGAIDYTALAGKMDMTEGAARVAVHRLRKRFRARFREMVALTLENVETLEEEIRYLATVLAE